MPCSLYGKLPSKRDFVAIGASRRFLDAWEPWLQTAMSTSRHQLDAQWQAAFLTAPIWRFWLGADICGCSTLGAVMSSLDGVGRYFPLTLFAGADDGATIAPPELDPQDGWFDAAESLLISALEQANDFEGFSAQVSALPQPAQTARDPEARALLAERQSFAELFGALRARHPDTVYAGASFWWTVGGENFPPIALSSSGLPDPMLFAAMLTGEFAKREA
jgi:type VI secretion system protein ImpM